MNIRKNIVLLQGPVGPFFDELQGFLSKHEISCTRILFNAGDRLFCPNKKNVINFEGNLENWSSWLGNYIKKKSPSKIILFGADRPIHSIARKLCNQFNIDVISLEEGYFRPGFVTIEEGGNNANSPIAGKLPFFKSEYDLENLEHKETISISRNSFSLKCWYGFLYYFWSELWTSSKQKKLFHKNLNLFHQAFFWPKNFFYWLKKRKKEKAFSQRLLNENYYLVALQLDTDMQSRFQSNGWKKMDLIKESIQSFANKASSQSHLVFKVHPLERGHYNYQKIIKTIARNFGIEDRVWVIQTGGIGQWVKFSKGMITINSTSGFSAIFHGVPILLLGNAIYDHDSIVYKLKTESDFDQFWKAKSQMDFSDRMNYLAWVKSQACRKGDFYTSEGRNWLNQETIKFIK